MPVPYEASSWRTADPANTVRKMPIPTWRVYPPLPELYCRMPAARHSGLLLATSPSLVDPQLPIPGRNVVRAPDPARVVYVATMPYSPQAIRIAKPPLDRFSTLDALGQNLPSPRLQEAARLLQASPCRRFDRASRRAQAGSQSRFAAGSQCTR